MSTLKMWWCLLQGNPTCRQIGWGRDRELIDAWKEARTGFPFIDAIMTQLREEGEPHRVPPYFYSYKRPDSALTLTACAGWIHHLARHAVACFLTRGDLYQHWEEVCCLWFCAWYLRHYSSLMVYACRACGCSTSGCWTRTGRSTTRTGSGCPARASFTR
jgi:hypothetical protein